MIVKLIAQGKTQKEVAHLLNISLGTVKAHRSNVTNKLGIVGIADLTRYAVTEGIIILEKAS